MRRTVSYEKTGTTAIAYFTVEDYANNRVSGLGVGDFTFDLFDTSGADISGSTVITIDEFGTTGAYTASWTVPSTQGEYSLVIFNATYFVQTGKSCQFLCYITLIGDSGDSSAAMDFTVANVAGAPVTGLTSANFTWNVWNPSEVNVGGGIADPVSELGNGKYRFSFSTISEEGRWFVDLFSVTYFKQGKQGLYRYNLASAEVAGAPSIITADNDETGTSATLTLVSQNVNDELFVYYRTYPSGSWILWPSSRVGSGTLQITGLTNKQRYEFIAFASRAGSPVVDQSPPSNTRQVYVTDNTFTFTDIRQYLYDWASGIVPVTWIWIPSNGPQPAVPFGTLRMKPTQQIGHDYHSPPDDDGVEEVISDDEFMFEVQVYGTVSPTGEDQAMSWAKTLEKSLSKRSTLDELGLVGLALVETEAITDLGDKGRKNYEARALLEVRFRIGLTETDTVGVIETSDAPTGTFS